MRTGILLLGVLLSAWPSAASAAWQKASTKHFIIYADAKPEWLRSYAEKLERFDQAVRYARRMEDFAVGVREPPHGFRNQVGLGGSKTGL